MIDKRGKLVIPAEYTGIGNELTPAGVDARKGETFGIVSNGTFNVIEGADKVWGFHGDAKLTYARKDKKLGFVNSKGEWVIQPTYDKAKAFVDGLAPVSNDKMWGFVNESGEMVIEASYRDAEVFAEGLAGVKDKKWGFIDETGKLIIPMEYDITAGLSFSGAKVKGFINGLTRVKTKKGWGFLDKTGKLLADKWFENAEPFVKN